jgi:hypothetical protein
MYSCAIIKNYRHDKFGDIIIIYLQTSLGHIAKLVFLDDTEKPVLSMSWFCIILPDVTERAQYRCYSLVDI